MRIHVILVIATLLVGVSEEGRGRGGSRGRPSSYSSSMGGGGFRSHKKPSFGSPGGAGVGRLDVGVGGHRPIKFGADDDGNDFRAAWKKYSYGSGINKNRGGYSSGYDSSTDIAGSSWGGSSEGGRSGVDWYWWIFLFIIVVIFLMSYCESKTDDCDG